MVAEANDPAQALIHEGKKTRPARCPTHGTHFWRRAMGRKVPRSTAGPATLSDKVMVTAVGVPRRPSVTPVWREAVGGRSKVRRKHLDTVRNAPMLGDGSFGHSGAGGRLAFAHPESGTAVGYVCSPHGRGLSRGPRCPPAALDGGAAPSDRAQTSRVRAESVLHARVRPSIQLSACKAHPRGYTPSTNGHRHFSFCVTGDAVEFGGVIREYYPDIGSAEVTRHQVYYEPLSTRWKTISQPHPA
jgi:hypothetical protein